MQNLDCAINCWKRNCLHENEPETNVRQRSNYPGQSLNDTFNALFGKVFPEWHVFLPLVHDKGNLFKVQQCLVWTVRAPPQRHMSSAMTSLINDSLWFLPKRPAFHGGGNEAFSQVAEGGVVVEKCGSQFGGKDRSLEQEVPQGKAWRAYAGEGESITARGERCWAARGEHHWHCC